MEKMPEPVQAKEYKILFDTDPVRLAKSVSEMLSQGWRLFGEMRIDRWEVEHAGAYTVRSVSTIHFVQVMVMPYRV